VANCLSLRHTLPHLKRLMQQCFDEQLLGGLLVGDDMFF